MLPYHSLVAVWQEEDNAVLPDPLALARADELVDDALGRVGKVPKLGLPQHQRIRVRQREAKLKPCKNLKTFSTTIYAEQCTLDQCEGLINLLPHMFYLDHDMIFYIQSKLR